LKCGAAEGRRMSVGTNVLNNKKILHRGKEDSKYSKAKGG
jgi:hypothetical protein